MDPDDLTALERLPNLDSVRIAVIDVETSGLSPAEHHLLQIAVLVVDGRGRVLHRWSSDVRPPGGLFGSVGPRHVHGLTRRRLWRAPRIEQALGEVAPLLTGAVVAGHNVAFDLSFLEHASRASGIPIPVRPSLCTLDLSRLLDPERRRRHRLADLCQFYGIALDRPHDALADAEATAVLLGRLLDELAVEQPGDLVALIRGQRDAA